MKGFVPMEKTSKKARREVARQKRVLWNVKPVSRRVESKKLYERRWKSRPEEHSGGFCFC